MHHKLQHLGSPKLPGTSFKLCRKRWTAPGANDLWCPDFSNGLLDFRLAFTCAHSSAVFMNLMRDAPVITTKVTVMQHDVVASVRPDLPPVTQQGNQTSHAVADRSQLRKATPVTGSYTFYPARRLLESRGYN